ncbi:MAG: SAM-dependent methyltransferase, partial [Candidatus Limnocylindrales bacterium]
REQSRVAASSGAVAAYVWDYAAGMSLLRYFWKVARSISPSAAALDEAVRFPKANPRGLERLFEAAGMDPLETTSLEVEAVFAGFTEVWAPFERGQGAAPSFVAGLDELSRQSLRSGLEAALPTADDGSIHLSARAWAIRARP